MRVDFQRAKMAADAGVSAMIDTLERGHSTGNPTSTNELVTAAAILLFTVAETAGLDLDSAGSIVRDVAERSQHERAQ